MSWRRQLSKVGALFRRPKAVDDLAEEIRLHLEMEEQENLESGMSPDEAHYAALRRFGNVTLAQERSREMWGWDSVETAWQDLRYGLSMLAKNPGFTAMAVITLALAIGANTAIFSVVSAVLLKPIPYKDPTRLVSIGETLQYMGAESGVGVSGPDFIEWTTSSHAFEEMAATMNGGFDVAGGDVPEKIEGAYVSPNFFSLLEIKPLFGRSFRPEEGQMGQDRAVVLSYGVWQRRFGSDLKIIGRTLTLNNQSYMVVGVLPKSFEFSWGFYAQNTHLYDIWVPLALNTGMLTA